MFCVYVHFFDMKTKKNVIKKKLGQPGFEPTIDVSGAILTNHKYNLMSYQRISSQLYQDVYFRYGSKHTDCTRSITKNYNIQYRKNLFMHKGQDQVNFVEVYMYKINNISVAFSHRLLKFVLN